MKHIFLKELRHYFFNPFGYILVVLATLIANALFIRDIYSVGLISMKPFFLTMYWVMVLLIPALCMRSFAEERKAGTLETLLTLPFGEKEIAVGKLLAVLSLIGATFLLSLVLPVSFAFISGLYLPEVFVGYLGLILVAGMFSTLSLYVSLKTSNQVLAFFISSTILFCLSIFSADILASFIPRVVSELITPLLPLANLENFTKGIVDLRSMFYFISFTAVFMYAVIKQLEHRD
ncbi:MAG: ABC transporter permease subunit [Microgenomates group bacterium]|jgi:ABC-2 type transport system permease protein|nr:ABC transporter permease subunit [Candidatus Woesebacteria bacterium]MBP6883416.1 ABC transporter permease subunit [Candidatus Woesebacteria bacterium]QQR63791.1 MAG: ABC transporter permease subunit [Candidatus Roizmanbacteria bacterium]